MNIAFLQVPEIDDLAAFEDWLKGEGYFLSQIAIEATVKEMIEIEHTPCIVVSVDDISLDPSLLVLDCHNQRFIIWSTLENELANISDMFGYSYWVAVNVENQEQDPLTESDDKDDLENYLWN